MKFSADFKNLSPYTQLWVTPKISISCSFSILLNQKQHQLFQQTLKFRWEGWSNFTKTRMMKFKLVHWMQKPLISNGMCMRLLDVAQFFQYRTQLALGRIKELLWLPLCSKNWIYLHKSSILILELYRSDLVGIK